MITLYFTSLMQHPNCFVICIIHIKEYNYLKEEQEVDHLH